jgi:hypothetical protein
MYTQFLMMSADYIIAVRQCIRALVTHLYVVTPLLLSYIPVFGSFVLFLFWNNGIVLGKIASRCI